MIDTIDPNSFYNVGGHFLFYFLITTHICLAIEISPWQKGSTCTLKYLIAGVVSALISSIATNFILFPSPLSELSVGIGSAILICVLITLTIQHFFSLDRDL